MDSADIFQASLGNIPAGEVVVLVLSYVTELQAEGDQLRFTLPTSVGARHGTPSKEGFGSTASASSAKLSLAVDIKAHSGITGVSCPSHAATVTLKTEGDSRRACVQLEQQTVDLGDDLHLLISQLRPHEPRVWVETDETSNSPPGEAAESLSPPDVATANLALLVSMFPDMDALDFDNDTAGEYIFVVDRSGSMSGSRMRHAISALQLCLRSIPEGSTFNVIGFGRHHESLFPAPAVYNDSTLATASEHVRGLQANMGGTNIMGPLQEVFASKPDRTLPRQILLFTDGEVRNTRAIVDLVRKEHKATGCRLFSFGIGREVSHALVQGCAVAGGGAAEFISPDERMEAKVMRQMAKAVQPALTDLSIEWGELKPFLCNSGSPRTPRPLFQGSRSLAFATLKLLGEGDSPAEGDAPRDPAAAASGGGSSIALPHTATITVKAKGPDGELTWPLTIVLPKALVAASALALTGTSGAEGGPAADAASDSDDDEEEEGVDSVLTKGRLVATAAARNRIRDLEQDGAKGRVEAVQLATAYNVACKWASFVAVERRDSKEVSLDAWQPGEMRQELSGKLASRSSSSAARDASKGTARRRGHPGMSMRMEAAPQRSMVAGFARALAVGSTGGRGSGSRGGALRASRGGEKKKSSARSRVHDFDDLREQGASLARFAHSAPSEASESEDCDVGGFQAADRLDFAAAAMPPQAPPPGACAMPPMAVGALQPKPAGAVRAVAASGPVGGMFGDSAEAKQDAASRPTRSARAKQRAPQRHLPSIPMEAAPPEQQLSFIVLLQASSGAFSLDDATAQVAMKTKADLVAAMPVCLAGAEAGIAQEVWATAVVLAVLESRIADLATEWAVMAKKARKFMRKHAACFDVPGADAKAKVSELERLASEFV